MSQEKALTRREFLKIAGIAGATIGVAGGLGGLVAACGGTATTTTTAGPTTTAGVTATTSGATTTVSAAAESGRDILVGIAVPKTGPLSTFMIPFDWVHGQWTKALGDGVVCGDGKNHPIKTTVYDTQSDTNRTAQVTGDLITNQKADVIFAGGAPDTMNPAADQCEALGCPGLMVSGPWQPFYFGRGGTPDKNPFKWSYALCVGTEAMAQCYVEMWDQLSTNKKVGANYSNGTDGQAWGDPKTGGPFWFTKGGYQVDETGFYQVGSEDYTQQISEYKKFGAEIVTGLMTSGDFTNFWKQCLQQGLKPKACTVALALTFAKTCEAIGPSAYGLTTEIAWHADYPYKSSFTGQTDREIADAYEADTGNQWVSGTEMYSLMELYVHVLKQVTNVDDKEAVIKAISTAKLDTMYGPVDFTLPVNPEASDPVTHPVPNALRMPTSAAQWRKGKKWPFEQYLVSSKFLPAAPTDLSKVEELKYS
ncbi:MAG: ABC transporter substrate-binding protein [Actinobacteria bacterium]|nr:ABC transporter substrate-binding protein [Actinomycetota bacterium]